MNTKTIASSISSDLAEKAMLVGLTIHGWQARKYDRKISAEVAEQHASTADAGRFNKHLLPGAAESYEAVHRKGRELRTFYYENTLPWSKDGQRILPTKNYEAFTEGVRKFRREYAVLTEEFLREYPLLKEDARVLLNGMFNDMDYPLVEDMRGKFDIEIETLPLPTAGDFRVALADGEKARIQAEIERRVAQEVHNANKDLWNRLRTAVDNINLRLGNTEGRFHNTLIRNLNDVLDLIPNLNFTDDPNLTKVAELCERTLSLQDPQTLRDDAGLRAQVAAQAQEIADLMDSYM